MIETEHWLIEGVNQWKQLFNTFNWYRFTLVLFEFENEKWLYGYELNVILLGLGIRIRYNTDKALEQFDEWEKEDDDDGV